LATQGATYCSQNGFRTCATTSQLLGACTDFSSTVTPCENGLVCSGGRCTDKCVDRCAIGQTQCAGFGVQSCERKATGCLDFSDPRPCGTGTVCQGGACVAMCTDQCMSSDKKCVGTDALALCAKQASGCNDFSPAQLCASGGTCSGGSCQACTNMAKRCGPTGNVEQCTSGAFTVIQSCAFGCNAGACVAATPCMAGEARCNGNNIEVCNSTGSAFLFAGSCANGCTGPGLCQGTCTTDTLRCNGNVLEKCTMGAFAAQMTCTSGCQLGQCVLDSLDVGSPMTVAGSLLIVKGEVTVAAAGKITGTAGVLEIRADSITVNGTIEVQANGASPVGTGGDVNSGAFSGCTSSGCAAGGGSYGTLGSGSNLGSTWGTFLDVSTPPGSPGGRGYPGVNPGGVGGKGGGVIRLIANTITVSSSGHVNAIGSPGDVGAAGSTAGGGGGGSGGTVLIAADTVNMQGFVSVAGGSGGMQGVNGGTKGGDGGGGRIKIVYGSTANIATGGLLPAGSFQSSLGTMSDLSVEPPTTIASSTHPDSTLYYNDGAPSLGFAWNHPFSGAMGFYQLLDNKGPPTTNVAALPGPSNAGDVVRADLISLDPTKLVEGDNTFHITTVTATAKVGQVEGNFLVRVNQTAPTVTSDSHATQTMWYSTHDAFMRWAMPTGRPNQGDDRNYAGVYYVVDDFGNTIPDASGTFVAINNKSVIKTLTNGVHAFHIVSVDTRGYLTKQARHFVVHISQDGNPPAMGTIQGMASENGASGPTFVPGANISVNRGLFRLPNNLPTTPDTTSGNTDGTFSVPVPPGTYEVTATKTGYAPSTVMVTVAAGPPTGTNITMTKLP
jgi:hypothetical protein